MNYTRTKSHAFISIAAGAIFGAALLKVLQSGINPHLFSAFIYSLLAFLKSKDCAKKGVYKW